MHELFDFFYPWGLIAQALALIHFFRRRPEGFWFFVIFFGGPLGAAVYFIVEVVPDFGLLRGAFAGRQRRSHITTLEAKILDNPSAGNLEELADLYLGEKQYAKARDTYTHAIETRADSIHAFYHRGACAAALGDFAAALPDLEYAVGKDPNLDYYKAAALLADCYARTGQTDLASAWYAELVQYTTTLEHFYNYALFLKSQNRLDEARQWTEALLHKKRTMPRYMLRIERTWFRKAEALQKELRTA